MTKGSAPQRALERLPQRPPAMFIADALGLDFLNSVATPVDTEIDWIDDGDGLLAWLAQAQLVPAETLEALRAGRCLESSTTSRLRREACANGSGGLFGSAKGGRSLRRPERAGAAEPAARTR